MNMAHDVKDCGKVISTSDIAYEEPIGKGSFGHVFRATLRTNEYGQGTVVAAKKVPLSRTSEEELNVLSRLRHKNVICYYGYAKEQTTLVIITELAAKGDLQTYLHRNKILGDDSRIKWITEAAEGLNYLHQNHYIHRDVKSNNYLITADDVLKLADFGTAGEFDETENTAHGQGTARWMAPEVVKSALRSTKSDVYSYGMVTWEICTHELPYSNLKTKSAIMDAVVAGRRPGIPKECPAILQTIIRYCWRNEYQRRPSMDEVVQYLHTDQVSDTATVLDGYQFSSLNDSDSDSDSDDDDEYDKYDVAVEILESAQNLQNIRGDITSKADVTYGAYAEIVAKFNVTQTNKAEDKRMVVEKQLLQDKEDLKSNERISFLMNKMMEMENDKAKMKNDMKGVKNSIDKTVEDWEEQSAKMERAVAATQVAQLQQYLEKCKDTEDLDEDKIKSFTRMSTINFATPTFIDPSESPELRTYDAPQPVTDVFKLKEAPIRSTLLTWKDQLQAKARKTENEGFPYIEVGSIRYNVDSINYLLLMHKVISIRANIAEELGWFFAQPVVGLPLEKKTDGANIKPFQELVFHKRWDEIFDEFEMDGAELAQICCDRLLSGDHIKWFIYQLNKMQKNVFCIYPHSGPNPDGIASQFPKGQTKPHSLVFILNVYRSQNGVFLGTQSNPGSHFTFCYVNALTGSVLYGDSLGWPIPDDLEEMVTRYNRSIYSKSPDFHIYTCHDPTSFTEHGVHICSDRCATYYPLQTCGSICSVVCMFICAIACLNHNFFVFLTTIQQDSIYYVIPFLQNPSKYSKFLREALLVMFGEKKIDISYLTPTGFDKYQLVANFDPSVVGELDYTIFYPVAVPVPGLLGVLFQREQKKLEPDLSIASNISRRKDESTLEEKIQKHPSNTMALTEQPGELSTTAAKDKNPEVYSFQSNSTTSSETLGEYDECQKCVQETTPNTSSSITKKDSDTKYVNEASSCCRSENEVHDGTHPESEGAKSSQSDTSKETSKLSLTDFSINKETLSNKTEQYDGNSAHTTESLEYSYAEPESDKVEMKPERDILNASKVTCSTTTVSTNTPLLSTTGRNTDPESEDVSLFTTVPKNHARKSKSKNISMPLKKTIWKSRDNPIFFDSVTIETFTRHDTTSMKIPQPDIKHSSGEVVIYQQEMSCANVFKAETIPKTKILLAWEDQLTQAISNNHKCAYIETEQERYDLLAIRHALLLNKGYQTAKNVRDELAWFTGYRMKPIVPMRFPDEDTEDTFRSLLYSNPMDEVYASYNMSADELSKICCERPLTYKHIQWIVETLNKQQNCTRCICRATSNDLPTTALAHLDSITSTLSSAASLLQDTPTITSSTEASPMHDPQTTTASKPASFSHDVSAYTTSTASHTPTSKPFFDGSTDYDKHKETSPKSSSLSNPSALLFIFNVFRQRGHTDVHFTDETKERHPHQHHAICYFDISSRKLVYGDTSGWPAPVNLLDKVSAYYHKIYGTSMPEHVEVELCHDATFNTAEGKHVCSPLCATYFPLDIPKASIDVFVITISSIACIAPQYFRFLTSIQYNKLHTGTLALHMYQPALHSNHLRRVLACWFANKEIDVSYVVPIDFEKIKRLTVDGRSTLMKEANSES